MSHNEFERLYYYALWIVKSKVTTLSQPAEFNNVCEAVSLEDVYVLPSIQVQESQAVWKSPNSAIKNC